MTVPPLSSGKRKSVVKALLITVIRAYRLIPCRVRRSWSFGHSTSHLGLAAVRDATSAREALTAFLVYISPSQLAMMLGHPKPSWGDNDFNNTW
jgi:hypothetical protein